jgi:hypothetical protein
VKKEQDVSKLDGGERRERVRGELPAPEILLRRKRVLGFSIMDEEAVEACIPISVQYLPCFDSAPRTEMRPLVYVAWMASNWRRVGR